MESAHLFLIILTITIYTIVQYIIQYKKKENNPNLIRNLITNAFIFIIVGFISGELLKLFVNNSNALNKISVSLNDPPF